jgi:hypothetical protein
VKLLDWRDIWDLFDKISPLPPLSRGPDELAVLESFNRYGIKLRDPVHLYVAFDELAENAAMVLGELERNRDHFPIERLGQLFAMACDWVLRELWVVAPEEVRNRSVTQVTNSLTDIHLSSLNWRLMQPHIVLMKGNYVRMRQLDDMFEADERDVEELGAIYREGMVEGEVRLRTFVSMYILLRVESVVAEMFPGYAESRGIDVDLLKITLVSRFRIVLANLPPIVRKALEVD